MNSPVANQYDPINAAALCAASAAAYGLGGSGDQMICSHTTDTSVLIRRTADDLVIAFRGTADWRNWETDLSCGFLTEECCRIHGGFWRALDSVFRDVVEVVYRPQSHRRIWVTGHSLGGALAMLFAWRCVHDYRVQRFSGVYTFGQPRVGDAWFRDLYQVSGLEYRTFRVVHGNDIVPRVPWLLGAYRHAGHEAFYACPGWPMMDASPLAKLPWDARNAWRELFADKIALLADHHVATYQSLFVKPQAPAKTATMDGQDVNARSAANRPGQHCPSCTWRDNPFPA